MEKNLSEESSVHLRLIPLTSEIKLAMMEFNSPNTDMEDSNSKSLNDFIREKFEQNLHKLESSLENCVKKEELTEIINQRIQDKLALCPSTELTNTPPTISPNQVTIEFVGDESSAEELDVKGNFSTLEKRINVLETTLSAVLQMVPKIKKVSKNFKIDQQSIDQKSIESGPLSSDEKSGDNFESTNSLENHINPYDEMYYEWRQNKMNLLHYKQSECSLNLNRKLEMESSHGILPNYSISTISKPSVKAKFINSKHLLV